MIESGAFRGEGVVRGRGTVHLSNSGVVDGTEPGGHDELLRRHFEQLVSYAITEDPRRRALFYFDSAVRHQFNFGGNMRTARLMMTGVLFSAGFAGAGQERQCRLPGGSRITIWK